VRLDHIVFLSSFSGFADIVLISQCNRKTSFKVFGGYSVGVTPVLIPNTEVKSYRANDTALETVWESRSLPKLFEKPLLFEGAFSYAENLILFAKKPLTGRDG
jgi:hypothetical protein